MIEIFKDIPCYEGLYQVSNLGNVLHLSNNKKRQQKKIKPCVLKNGYLQVALYYKGSRERYTVHQLVVMAFLNHKPNGTHKLVVDHINGVRSDNRLENLQLITQRENVSKDQKNKTSKYTGVNWHKPANKWRAKIYINGKSKHLGVFVNEYDAHLEYQKALEEITKGK